MSIKNFQPIKKFQDEKGFAAPVIVAIVVLILAIFGIGYFILQQNPPKINMENFLIEEEKNTMGGEIMEKEGIIMGGYIGNVLAGNLAPLLEFAKSDYDSALKSDKLVVLYFYANWCPICKVEVSNALYPAFNDLTTDRVIGFRVNYNDNQTDNDEKNLAREFGVAYQHTKVFLKDGQRVLKSPESWEKDRYLNEINKFIQ